MSELEGRGAPEASGTHSMSADLPLSTTERTRLHRLRERGRAGRADLYAVLDAGLICHLGVIADGSPVALPTGYGGAGHSRDPPGPRPNRALLDAAGPHARAPG